MIIQIINRVVNLVDIQFNICKHVFCIAFCLVDVELLQYQLIKISS